MAGYQRTDTEDSIANGNVINANALDAEFNAMAAAMVSSTGHTHGGSAGEGAPITKLGPVQDLVVSASSLLPKLSATLDLGSTLKTFKDFFLSGIGYIDKIIAQPSTLANPSYTFSGASGTGISYNQGSSTLHVSFGGESILAVTSGGIYAGLNKSFIGELVVPNDTALQFNNIAKHVILYDPGYGFNVSSGRLGIVVPSGGTVGFNFDENAFDKIVFNVNEATYKTANGVAIQSADDRKLCFRNSLGEEVGMLYSETSSNNIHLRRRTNSVTASSLELKANGDIAATVGQFQGNGSGLTTLNASNLATGTVPAARLGATTGDRDWVLARTADAGVGSVGTYALLCQATASTTNILVGDILAGSGLRFSGLTFSALNTTAESGTSFGGTPTGSWEAQGTANDAQSVMRITLFKRIS